MFTNIKHLVSKTKKSVEASKSRNNFKVGQSVQAPDPHGKHLFRHGIVIAVEGENVTIRFTCTHGGPDSKKSVFVNGRWVKETVVDTFHFSQVRNS